MVYGGREGSRGGRCEYPNKSHDYQEKENTCWKSKPKSLLVIMIPILLKKTEAQGGYVTEKAEEPGFLPKPVWPNIRMLEEPN